MLIKQDVLLIMIKLDVLIFLPLVLQESYKIIAKLNKLDLFLHLTVNGIIKLIQQIQFV